MSNNKNNSNIENDINNKIEKCPYTDNVDEETGRFRCPNWVQGARLCPCTFCDGEVIDAENALKKFHRKKRRRKSYWSYDN